MKIYIGFSDGSSERGVYIDNVRAVGGTATDATEEASDLLHGATRCRISKVNPKV